MRRLALVVLVLFFLAPGIWAAVSSACDDENDENGDVPGCFLSKAVVDLDAALPTATIFGVLCDTPVVLAGSSDGAMDPVPVLSSERISSRSI